MSKSEEFKRGEHGLKADRLFCRSGVIGEKGKDLTAEQIAKLTDDDVAVLREQGILSITKAAAAEATGGKKD